MNDRTGGADRFVVANGEDTIPDFENGRDRIDLRGYAAIDDLTQLRAFASADEPLTIDLGARPAAPRGTT